MGLTHVIFSLGWVFVVMLSFLFSEVAQADGVQSESAAREPYIVARSTNQVREGQDYPNVKKNDLIYATLNNDTAPGGVRDKDGVTYDPTISGRLVSREKVHKLKARFHGKQSFVDITPVVQANGEFLLDMAELERIRGGRLEDGPYAVHLEAEDQNGITLGSTDIAFTLDTAPPQPVIFEARNGGTINLDLGFVDVALRDSSNIDQNTISPENVIIRNGNRTLPTVSAQKTSDGLFRYYYKGKLSEGLVTVTYIGKQTSDIAGNVNAQQTQSFNFNVFQPTFNGIPQRLRRLQIEPNINPPHNEDSGGSVYLHSGEAFLNRTDLEIPGRGFNWSFERTYRSGWLNYETPLGHNWDFNYNRRLFDVVSGPPNPGQINVAACNGIFHASLSSCTLGDVVRIDGQGREDLYKGFLLPKKSKTFESPPGFYTRLTRGNGVFIERDQLGNIIKYDDRGGRHPMISFTDRNGNTMRFEYDEGQLKFVVDTLDRTIEYFYDDNLLTKVRDFSGRELRFDYDDHRDLIAVTGPTVKDTPHGNDFLQGKTEQYTYDTSSHVLKVHNLRTVTAPNEVARGGPPFEVYKYDDDDRVIEHAYGGTNHNGVPAGGKLRYGYSYETGGPTPVGFYMAPSTSVTDRNGNNTNYEFSSLGNWNQTTEFTNRDVRTSDPSAYFTHHQYDRDGQRLTVSYHEGNSIQYIFDATNNDRLQQGNLLQVTHRPDSDRSGDQTEIVMRYSYEPVYNQQRTVTDPRGYTTTYTFDYQEGSNFAALATKLGNSEAQKLIEEAGIPMGLGDLNGDGRTDQIAGNVVHIERPTVNLLPTSNQAGIEGDTMQEIVELFVYNDFGQLIWETDPEGNVTRYEYYSERDPDGDGNKNGNRLGACRTGGYLRQMTRDVISDPRRNSGTNPPPARIRTSYKYDPRGNVIQKIDGRGIVTNSFVNELNQVVQVDWAADQVPHVDLPIQIDAGCDGGVLQPTLLFNLTTNVPVRGDLVVGESISSKGFGYIERFWYDFNDNLVLNQKEDRGNTSKVDGNPPDLSSLPLGNTMPDSIGGRAFADELYKYDIMNNRIETIQEVENGASPHFLRTRARYEANENLTLTIFPEGNVNQAIYDERDLVFRQIRGALNPEINKVLESGAVTAVSIPSTGMVNAAASWTTDQWFNQFVRITGGKGEGQFRRIVANTQTILTVSPPWDIPPNATSTYEIGVTMALLHPDDPTDYDVRGGLPCECQSFAYDGNQNVIETVDAADTDLSPDNNNPELGPGDRTRYDYDGFDRLVSAIDSVGNQMVYQYDPVGNMVRELHFGPTGGPSTSLTKPIVFPGPVSVDGVIQGANLVNSNLLAATEYLYDELNRKFQMDQVLFVNTIPTVRTPNVADGATDLGKQNLTPGDSQAIPGLSDLSLVPLAIAGRVSTRTEFDRKSRATVTIEDDGDTSRTFYDGDDRVIKTEDPEGNTIESAYDANDNLIEQRQIDIAQRVAGGGGTLQRSQSTGSNGVWTLNDTMQSWRPFEWTGRTLQITAGTGAGQVRRIVHNTSNQLTVGNQDWDVLPDSTSTYSILPISLLHSGLSTGFNTATTLNDATQTWEDNEWGGADGRDHGGNRHRPNQEDNRHQPFPGIYRSRLANDHG